MNPADLYKKAYDAHYEDGDLEEARVLYQQLVEGFAQSKEAGYARSQLEHLNRAVRAEPNMAAESPKRLVILTTAPSVEGARVVETLDIVASECVFGMNAFKDALAGLRDIFGGRSKTLQKALREARLACMSGLREEAERLQADAVIGISLSIGEYGNNSMVLVFATGTAVRLEPSPAL